MSRGKKRTQGLSEMPVSFVAKPPTPAVKKPRPKKNPDVVAYSQAFGARMASARDKKGMTQTELAIALRTTLDKVKKQELGETAFPIYMLPTLARVVCRSLNWLVTGQE